MAPLGTTLNRSLHAEPATSESEIEPEVDELSSDSRSDSDNDTSIEVSATDLSEVKDYDSNDHEISNLSHRKRLIREQSRISGSFDAKSESRSVASNISEDEGTVPFLSGLDNISFGALAAAQASLTQGATATATATTPTSHNSTRHPRQALASTSLPAANNLKRKRGSDTSHSHSHDRNHSQSHSRPSKHAPATMSSAKPVSRRRIVVSGSEPISNSNIPGFGLVSGSMPNLSPAVNSSINQDGNHHHSTIRKARDPRFTPLSGSSPTPATLQRRYAFLDEYRAAEAEALRNVIDSNSNKVKSSRSKKKEKKDAAAAATAAATATATATGVVSEETRAAARAALQKHTALARNRERAVARQELVRAHRRQERELLKQGRKGKAWFLKRSILRERASAVAGSGSGVTTVNSSEEADTPTGKNDRADPDRNWDHATLQNKKREVRKEKKLMKKEKSIMGQRRRT